MNLKQSIFLLLVFFLKQNAYSQPSSLVKVYLSNWGYIYLPKNMEIQAGIYKQILDDAKKEITLNAERVVFQQKGLNEGKLTQTFARVIIRTDISTETFPDLNTHKITSNELNDLNNTYKEQLYEIANNSNSPVKIISWNNLKLTTINGRKCINYSYTRKIGDNPETYSEFFIFWKNKKQHTINIEYWLSDSYQWKTEMMNCLNSLNFI